MNRLQKKCLIVSAGTHVLLGLIIVIGPGFMSSSRRLDNLPEITFTPIVMTDQLTAGGGNPNARQAPLVPPVTPIQPSTPPPELKPEVKPRRPDPPPEPVKETKPVLDSLEPSESKKKLPQIPTKVVERTRSTSKTSSKAIEDAKAEERREADARRRLAGEIARAADSIRAGTASATSIVDPGPGGGGPAYANYAAWVKTVYENAWVPPEEAGAPAAVVYASVTIQRDGTVISKSITTRSGDSQVDSSVQRTLDSIPTIGRSFPEGVKDQQRTYTLKFDLKAKRGTA